MHCFLEIAATGLHAVLLHPLRSLVSVAALVAVLLPYLVGLALARGLEDEAEASARFGADLYAAGSQFGRPVPLPLDAAQDLPRRGASSMGLLGSPLGQGPLLAAWALVRGRTAVLSSVRNLPGVVEATPRIVGEVFLGKDRIPAVLVGLPAKHFGAWAACVQGELPRPGGSGELVVGTALARRLGLKVGAALPPFYHNREGDRLSRVVGVFKADAPLWQAHLILTTFETAEFVFDQPGLATDLLVTCRPGYQAAVTRALQRLEFPSPAGRGVVRLRVTAREDLLALLPRGLRHREGVFHLHFLLAFVVAILVLLVTSGVGLAERRREIGILKATGWQTDEILLRGVTESLCLSLAGACVALLLAWVWLAVFNGWGVAGLFLAGAEAAPDFAVPYRLAPVPALLAFVLSFAVVLTGTLWSSWRAATTPPWQAMR